LLPWTDLAGKSWRFKDLLTTEEFNRDGTELATEGLFVDLPPWGFHLLMVQ
jgi:hypothetical protein